MIHLQLIEISGNHFNGDMLTKLKLAPESSNALKTNV